MASDVADKADYFCSSSQGGFVRYVLIWASLNFHSIYIEDLQKSANEGLLNIDFENSYMLHTAFIHGHAHWPAMPAVDPKTNPSTEQRKFYGSVQPAVFDGPRIWTADVRALAEKCFLRLAPIMKALGETAPPLKDM